MVCNHHFLLVGENSVFLLITCNNCFNAFLKVSLRCCLSSLTDGSECRFIDDIGKFRARCPRSHASDLRVVHIRLDFDLLYVNLEYLFSALEVGKLYGNATVESTGTRKCGIKHFGTVGCCKNDYSRVAFKAVHFGKELIERLLTLVVTAHTAVATLTADGVNFVNKHDARCFFLSLLKEVSYLGCTHTDEHFHELRA